jgi:hypothetical protein
MDPSGDALLPAGALHCQSLPRRTHVARLHGSRRTGHLPLLRHRPGRGDELETVPQSAPDGQPLLVLLGHAAAGLPGLAAAQPRRQPGTVARPGVQHLHLVHGQLQPPALQRRDGPVLLHAAVRHHALPVRHRRLRHGRHGRNDEGAGGQNDEDHRQLLGLPHPERDAHPDAAVARRRHPARHQRHADVLRRQANAHDARRRRTGHLARPHRSHRAHQTAGNQRRRLLRNQLGAPARKPQRLHQHPRMLVDPDPAHGDGLRLRVLHAPTQARGMDFRRDAPGLYRRRLPLRLAGDGRQPADRRHGHLAGARFDGGQGDPHRPCGA